MTDDTGTGDDDTGTGDDDTGTGDDDDTGTGDDDTGTGDDDDTGTGDDDDTGTGDDDDTGTGDDDDTGTGDDDDTGTGDNDDTAEEDEEETYTFGASESPWEEDQPSSPTTLIIILVVVNLAVFTVIAVGLVTIPKIIKSKLAKKANPGGPFLNPVQPQAYNNDKFLTHPPSMSAPPLSYNLAHGKLPKQPVNVPRPGGQDVISYPAILFASTPQHLPAAISDSQAPTMSASVLASEEPMTSVEVEANTYQNVQHSETQQFLMENDKTKGFGLTSEDFTVGEGIMGEENSPAGLTPVAP